MNVRNATLGLLLAGSLALAGPAFSQKSEAPAHAVVTVIPKKDEAPQLQAQNLKLTVDGKKTEITGLQPYKGSNAGLELTILVDDSARRALGVQLSDLADFIQSLPPTTAVGVAYMQEGSSYFAQQFTTDHALAVNALRLPGGARGTNASPYFCLSDLAKRWPSNNPNARREVLMITDGVDRYNLRYDPEDPYLLAAISDAQKAGLVVYSIYFRDRGFVDGTGYETNAGQNLLSQVAEATGGHLYWEGMMSPVSFQPFLKDLSKRLANQYELGFMAPYKGKPDLVDIRVKASGFPAKIEVTQKVPVLPPA
ncbi:hypothetical protein [Acidipila rosea]|uniref:VWFA-related protein n=1 Tax=Acidipila rosea TaxID=768535 RepID=A0A4V2PVD5_9BACT|nr:hypothetical protein [Acidipila rosea]MBW4043721.1 hypothetical protein [Acidobacteriota bacterium]TCK74021.1 hypothetical protein C7378_1641 [Acidipila rosea]